MTINTHELTNIIFKAIEEQSKSKRKPPFLYILNASECSWEDFLTVRENLINRGYVGTLIKKRTQYEFLAIPKEVFQRNDI